MIKIGSRWSGNDRKVFVVLHTLEQDENTWVHYRTEAADETGTPKEFSCYQESFLSRFTPLPE